jgi:hypothetical protein
MILFRSTAMIPDYTKGKESAIRILKLNNRRSKINPHDTSGIVLVSIYQFEYFPPPYRFLFPRKI